ncbi:NAD-dependent epimerase/dehydratase family protein [Paenibacillus sp. LMG 31461]|uniref:NAD-dependent epimerase/dehydratase family protein n=1 Tax=Paenibacillus plantarum TaxID=2654975 RepID=A0ABX1XE26_9BACL|nr:GDP-mannose 4,6-dehydratase [Paenibacillus plantarum]NOU66735.1 NAD-dependent epimerase/dehydratase family protein [Paenibacillus plantarum]
MRALITGGSGFAGSYLIEYLLNLGYQVASMSNQSAILNSESGKVTWFKVDLCKESEIRTVIQSFQPDEIYHLAGLAVTTGQLPTDYYSNNFVGTVNLLQAVKEIRPSARILVVSTSGVYGQVLNNQMPISERTEIRPYNHYAASKAAAIAYQAENLPIVIARPFNHTGPRQTTAYVCAKLAKYAAEVALNRTDTWLEAGNLAAARDFTDVRDVVRAYHLLLRQGTSEEAYNICSGKAYEIGIIIDTLSRIIGQPLRIQSSEEHHRKQDASILFGNYHKLRLATGWEPQISLEQTLEEMVEYWKGRLEIKS